MTLLYRSDFLKVLTCVKNAEDFNDIKFEWHLNMHGKPRNDLGTLRAVLTYCTRNGYVKRKNRLNKFKLTVKGCFFLDWLREDMRFKKTKP